MNQTTLVISLIALACGVGHAQSTAAQPTFDAASVKPAPPPDGRGGRRVGMTGGPGTDTPGRINFENIGLGAVIGKAYNVKYYQIAGPGWFESERFNIIATAPPGTTQEQFRLMLQNLLADRFKLALHKETREMAIYSLGVAKNGPKLKKATPNPPPDANDTADAAPTGGVGKLAADADGYPALRAGMTMAVMSTPAGPRARLANKGHMEWLVGMLSGQLGRPVIDATGLTGEYDISLYWVPQRPDSIATDDPSGPDLIAALQQQLGLKLEPKKGPIEVLVVDRAEKIPTEN
jgi:uncharacterized protein (TIGR03435 family)